MLRKQTIKISELLYLLFFCLLLTAKGIGLYDGQTVFKIFLVAALAAWFSKMCMTLYTFRELCWVIGLVALGGIVYLVSGEKGILFCVMVVTGLKNVSQKRLIRVALYCWSLSFGAMFLIHALHLVDGPFKVHDKYGMGMVIRWGMGYSHPNVLHISYFTLVVLIVLADQSRFNWKKALGLMFGNILVFLYSLSNTGLLVVTAYLILNLYWAYREKLNKFEKALIQLVFPVFLIYSLVAPWVLQGKAFEVVDRITNTRFRLARKFLTMQAPTLLGTRLEKIITFDQTMDNSYVFAFVTYGVVIFAVIIGAYMILIHRECKEQKGKEICVVLSSLFAGLAEPFLFNTSFKNISLIFMDNLLFKEDGRREYGFTDLAEKEIAVPVFPEKGNAKKKLKKEWAAICLVAAFGVVIGAAVYQTVKIDPERVIVPRKECDIEGERESVWLTPEEVAQNAQNHQDRVIGYVDQETEMVIYSGNIVRLEHFRELIAAALTAGSAAGALAYVFVGIQYKRKKEYGREVKKNFDYK